MKINWGIGINMTRRSCLAAVMASVCLSASISFGEQYYRYDPKPASAVENHAAGDGVLVKEIPIKHGDTLYDLSRKFNGKGYYYPQILLFNDIKDPNKIYTGDLIKIPLGENAARNADSAEEADKNASDKRNTKKGKNKKSSHHIPLSSKSASIAKQESAVELSSTDLQRLGGANNVPATKAKRVSKRDRKIIKTAVKKQIALNRPTVVDNLPEPALQAIPEKRTEESSVAQKTFERGVKAFRQENWTSALEFFERFIAENPKSPLAADANLYKAECYLKQSGL